MESFSVRELKETDAEALLAFEVRNREWFESHIDARDASFYSLQGVAGHIESYLSDFAIGAWHPFVIEDSSQRIVGRANLKSIDSSTRSSEVGYRIDQRVCGQGLASHRGGTVALGTDAIGCVCLQAKPWFKKST
jgi:[ribosomal protein S5]-alanine N-acetyltransferase